MSNPSNLWQQRSDLVPFHIPKQKHVCMHVPTPSFYLRFYYGGFNDVVREGACTKLFILSSNNAASCIEHFILSSNNAAPCTQHFILSSNDAPSCIQHFTLTMHVKETWKSYGDV